MARTRRDPAIEAHLEWIGFVQPTGLVVSAPALVRVGAILNSRDAEGQRVFRECVTERTFEQKEGPAPWIADFPAFARSVLEWSFSPKGYAGISGNPIPPELEAPLPDYGETLRPHFAVRELDPTDGQPPWQVLVTTLEPGQEFDRVVRTTGRLEASPHGRMERLLRQTGVSAGLLFNGRALRLVSAPHGESSGWLDFRFADMVQTAGRPICTALRLLLSEGRLLAMPRAKRLAALLEDSRKFQNEVSELLGEQVVHALYELLRGFQAAHDASRGELLRTTLTEHPDDVYRALLTVILRLVFLLYAEERDMLPEHETFLRYYSLAGLYERLRGDDALFPDTMDQRYGAWAQLLVLFRMIHDGAESGPMRLPARHGVLFDPDRFPFFEGRTEATPREANERIQPPLVPDGTIYRVLEKLLVLDGERISYRALDVEQIGSVYETMMGFRLETATGRSVAIKAQKKRGAPTTIDLEAVLRESPTKREKWVRDHADRTLSATVKTAVEQAETVEDLHAALLPVIDVAATPDLVPQGAMVLQPTEERRRSGSHYTPRSFTEPIVRTTLEPILKRLGEHPTPAQILDLKICDLAVGSGAFQVETCRQLGDELVKALHYHGERPSLPPDETEELLARRLVAQRCLYGVDRNPMAVDLAKLSLWLTTLAKDHPFTFLDHSFRCGDSLVGLSIKQITRFHWDVSRLRDRAFDQEQVENAVARVMHDRREILQMTEDNVASALLKRQKLVSAEEALKNVREIGDLIIAAFFNGSSAREREALRQTYLAHYAAAQRGSVSDLMREIEVRTALRGGPFPVTPFHWEAEFPEVFERDNPGFDGFVGNPPFAGELTLAHSLGETYTQFLRFTFPPAAGKCDLVAFFLRRAFAMLRHNACFGLLATKTIREGDTREGGLAPILDGGGTIYDVRRRIPWPGDAAVVACSVHVTRGQHLGTCLIDGKLVNRVSAYFLQGSSDHDPPALNSNAERCFLGLKTGSTAFVVDPRRASEDDWRILRLAGADSEIAKRLRPYLAGNDLNDSPTCEAAKLMIWLEDLDEIIPGAIETLAVMLRNRLISAGKTIDDTAGRCWWKASHAANSMRRALQGQQEALVLARTSDTYAVCFVSADQVLNVDLSIFVGESSALFAVLQSRVHESWARAFSGSLKDDLRYTPTRCFETFPFPESWETHSELEETGKAYHEFRAGLMIRSGEGPTKSYNRFHDPEERSPDILRLRELHAAMDRAVLDAYGWSDIPTDCEFILDYEIDEEEWGNRKKPWRYRWPNDFRDEVLARLLELNAQRAAEEKRQGAKATRKGKARRAGTQPQSRGKDDSVLDLAFEK